MKSVMMFVTALLTLNGFADYANAEPKIGYGVEVGGAATNSDGAGVYGGANVENGEMGGMIAVDSGFMKI